MRSPVTSLAFRGANPISARGCSQQFVYPHLTLNCLPSLNPLRFMIRFTRLGYYPQPKKRNASQSTRISSCESISSGLSLTFTSLSEYELNPGNFKTSAKLSCRKFAFAKLGGSESQVLGFALRYCNSNLHSKFPPMQNKLSPAFWYFIVQIGPARST